MKYHYKLQLLGFSQQSKHAFYDLYSFDMLQEVQLCSSCTEFDQNKHKIILNIAITLFCLQSTPVNVTPFNVTTCIWS